MEPSTRMNLISLQTNREHQDTKVGENEPKTNTMQEFQVEKISLRRFLVFVVYTASFLIALNLRMNFSVLYSVNIAAIQFYLNEINTAYNPYQIINTSKLSFHEIYSKQELIKYIQGTLIYGMYQNQKGEIPEDNSTQEYWFSHYQTVTPLRILVKSSPVKYQPENVHFPTRWDLEASSSDQTTYGSRTMKFNYNSEQEGFILSIPVTLMSYKEAVGQFNDAIDNGFFSSQTKEVTIDFGVYSVVTKVFFVLKLELRFSPTGRIETLGRVTSCLLDFYYGLGGKFLLVFQIVFCCLFMFFFVQEMTELYAQISNGFPKYSLDESLKSKLAHVKARATHFKKKLFITLKGILNHIKDPWNFLDTISLGVSIYLMYIWISLLGKNTLRSTLDLLSTLPDQQRRGLLFNFNHLVDQTFSSITSMERLAGVNILVLLLKLLRYVASFNKKIQDLIRISISITQRVLPYFVLIFTILLAYTYLSHFLYGKSIEEFSTFFTSFRYLLTNIHGNYDKIDDIIAESQILAIFFHLLVILMISFMIVNIFSIYVIHGFEEYIKAKRAMKKIKNEEKDREKAPAHPIWLLKKILFNCANKLVDKFRYSHAYIEKKALREKRREKEMAELNLFSNINIDMDIEEDIKKLEIASLNPIFQTEYLIKKTVKTNKLRTVKLIWSSFSILVAICLLTIICLEHHKVSEAQYFSKSVIDILRQDNLMIMFENQTIISLSSQTDFVRLQEVQHIGLWMNDLFRWFLYPDNITLKNSENFLGTYLASQHFILTDTLRISIRMRSFQPIDDEEYQGVGNLTLSKLFQPDALNVENEYKLPIIGKSGTIYNYTEGNGYRGAGGYILEGTVKEFDKIVSNLYDDDVLNSRANSVILDFLIYLIKAENAMRVSIIFQMNTGAYISTQININFVNLNNYGTTGQFVIGFLEVVTLIWTFILLQKVILGLRQRNYHYNYWYSLHIQNIPEILKEKRERKCPEFLRKMKYLFNFECKLNMGIIFFILISAVIWIYYITGTQSTKEHLISFTKETPTATNAELIADLDFKYRILFTLKITEGLILLLMSIKLVYYYSFFDKFYFLIETMRKSLKWIPQMFIILVFILMAFGFFLQLLRGTKDAGYTSIANIVAQQLQFLNLFETQDRTIFDEPTGIFISLVFYVPWVLFVVSIVGNIFLGIVLHSYQSVKQRYNRGGSVGALEFFKITKKLITSKDTKQEQFEKVHFEANIQEARNNFKYQKLYEEFHDLVVLAKSYCNDMDLWTAACSKNILDEYTLRKTMRKIFKDITMASIVDFNYEKHEHMKILTDGEKFSQFVLRLRYWNYFKYGRKMTQQFMQALNRNSTKYDNQAYKQIREKKLQAKTDLTIKRYIVKLESTISQNIQDLLAMKKKLYEYEDDMHENGIMGSQNLY